MSKLPLQPAVLALLTILCILLSSCSNDSGSGRHSDTEAEKLTYRLKWLFNASAAGDIWADRAGFFTEAGLKVEIKEGGAEQDAITDIEMGRAQFGTASADQVIRAAAKGADVVVVAQIFQENPLQWIYAKEITHAVTGPEDLKGLTIGITYGGNDEAIFTALMKKYRLTEKDLNLYAVHYDYAPFWKGKVNLWPIYRNTEGIVLTAKMAAGGHTAAFFEPGRYGIKFVANSIITSGNIYRHKPEVVKKFTRVLMAAWTEALAEKNRVAVAEAVHLLDTDTPVPLIMKQLDSTAKFVLSPDIPTGTIDKRAWEQTASIMLDQDLIDHEVDLAAILDPKQYVFEASPSLP